MLRLRRKPRAITWKSFILLFIVLAIAGALKAKEFIFPDPKVPTADIPAVTYEEVAETPDTSTNQPAPVNGSTETSTPTTFNLAIPFTSQAPVGVWDAFHEETCDEASFYMAMEFFNGNKAENIVPATADAVFADMVELETSMDLGYSIDAAQSVTFLDAYTDDFTARVIENPTVDQIKELIAAGIPVIVPAAGRELGNPFFTGEGPLYHMLIIRGYTETTFITNDPGTRHGRNYTYTIPVLMGAMGDWNNGNPPDGASRVIIIEPVR
jgi:hypothetical protein